MVQSLRIEISRFKFAASYQNDPARYAGEKPRPATILGRMALAYHSMK
jgi:hypothetical protein